MVKIYNRVLTAAEVQQNFNAQRGRYGILFIKSTQAIYQVQW
jgi:hypothetical protein